MLKPNPNATYKNIIHAMRCMIKGEGIMAPLRGINIVAIGAGPAHALYFSSYEYVKKLLNGNNQKYNALSYGRCMLLCIVTCRVVLVFGLPVVG